MVWCLERYYLLHLRVIHIRKILFILFFPQREITWCLISIRQMIKASWLLQSIFHNSTFMKEIIFYQLVLPY